MTRRAAIAGLFVACLGLAGAPGLPRWIVKPVAQAAQPTGGFELEEATISALLQDQQSGRRTARQIAENYLARIQALDRSGPTLRAVIELNPDALTIADALDAERRTGGLRGRLHGIPILIKDNIDTADRMSTTAGLARARRLDRGPRRLRRRAPAGGRRRDSGQDQHERVGELPLEPLDERMERAGRPHAQSLRAGSQSAAARARATAAAIAANLAALAVGTETDGSIVCPGQRTCARRHQADGRPGEPVRHHPDRPQPGYRRPMARTVEDAAILLEAMVGADPRDPATDDRSFSDRMGDYPTGLIGRACAA